jgi:hypothetical protein
MKSAVSKIWAMTAFADFLMTLAFVYAQEQERTTYLPVDIKEAFSAIMNRMAASKAGN